MDRSPSLDQLALSPMRSRAATAPGTSRPVAAVNELDNLNRTLIKLDLELVICRKQIGSNLKRREILISQICILISSLEKSLVNYDQAENARIQFEENLGPNFYDTSDSETDDERQAILGDLHEKQAAVIKAERNIAFVRSMCAHVEPHLEVQKIENERIHDDLCERIRRLERTRREVIERRERISNYRYIIRNDN